MTKARHTSNLVDANGDIKSSHLDNVPASNDASALTTGTLPDARLSNQAKVVKGTSAPGSPQAGDLWYDTTTGINLLKVYNSSSSIWVATNVVSPVISAASAIENTVAQNITLTGTSFGSGQGVISFTPSGGSASTVNAVPTNDTSVTAAIPAAIYGQSVGTSIAITFQNSGGLVSASINVTVTAATTGGTKVISGGYAYHTFTSSGDFVLGISRNIEYMMVAGGGAAGSYAGGGGAGGFISGTKNNLSAGTYAIVIGGGGTNASGISSGQSTGGDGGNTTGLGETAIGGGGGADGSDDGRDGGSGGGSSYANASSGGSGTSGQGNDGGTSSRSDPYASAGGGGKGSAGSAAASNTNAGAGGAGDGTFSSWATATSTGDGGLYAGGGGGGVSSGSGYSGGGVAGAAGTGGGGAGGVGGSGMSAGDPNTGGGGGAGGYNGTQNIYRPQNGGSGIVILRYSV